MKSYRNNNRRGRYKNNDRNFKRNGETSKFGSDFTSNSNFKRKIPGRNNYNASKLILSARQITKKVNVQSVTHSIAIFFAKVYQ